MGADFWASFRYRTARQEPRPPHPTPPPVPSAGAMLRSARLQQRIQHPHVLRIVGIYEHGSYPCILLELAEGDVSRWHYRDVDMQAQWKVIRSSAPSGRLGGGGGRRALVGVRHKTPPPPDSPAHASQTHAPNSARGRRSGRNAGLLLITGQLGGERGAARGGGSPRGGEGGGGAGGGGQPKGGRGGAVEWDRRQLQTRTTNPRRHANPRPPRTQSKHVRAHRGSECAVARGR